MALSSQFGEHMHNKNYPMIDLMRVTTNAVIDNPFQI